MSFKSFMYEVWTKPLHQLAIKSRIRPIFLQVVAQKFQWRDIPGESKNESEECYKIFHVSPF